MKLKQEGIISITARTHQKMYAVYTLIITYQPYLD